MHVLQEASPAAADPVCVHASSCPGCPWIERPYGAQMDAKAERVAGALVGFHELGSVSVLPTAHAPEQLGYRVRAKLVADASGALGLYARGTHDVVDLPHCRVLDARVAVVAQCLRQAAAPGSSLLEGADIARVDDVLMVTLIARADAPDAAIASLVNHLKATCADVVSIAVTRRSSGAVQLLGGELQHVHGPRELRRRVHPEGPYHYATFGAFVQAHPAVAHAMYEQIAARVFASAGPKPRVLELYAGSGALSLALAARGAQVVSVEAFGPATELLGRAAREQSLPLQIRHGDAGEEAQRAYARGEQFDVVLVNPPRRGLDLEVRRAIARLAPKHVAYMSCHPATLARDLAHLAQEGLSASELAPFDMMPMTEHVETLAWLSRAPAPAPRVLFGHDDFVAVFKEPHEPTTPQGEHESSLLQRVRMLPGCELAVPVHRLDVGTSGAVLFARTADRVAGLSRALTEGEKIYTALAQAIVHGQGWLRRPIAEQGKMLEASTRYKRSEVVAGHSLVRVSLETGRKHQIRKHFAGVGHPLVGDARYGERRTNVHFAMRHGLDRPFLHCESISIVYEGQPLVINAPLAADLVRVLESMRDESSSPRKSGRDQRGGTSPAKKTLSVVRR